MVKLVQGKVEQISIKPIANGPDRFDNTHRKSAKVDGVWYSFGGAKSAKWNVKDGAEFKELGVGSEIAFKAEQSGDFWNAKSLMPINVVPPSASQGGGQQVGQSSGGYTPKEPFDETGMLVCHGLNGAMALVSTGRFDSDNDTLLKLAKDVHATTTKLKETVSKEFPDMNKKSVGNYSGNAVNAACLLVESTDDLYAVAYDYLVNVTMKMDAFIRTPKEEAKSPPVKVTRSPAKKPMTKAKPVEESFPDLEDGSEDLPF